MQNRPSSKADPTSTSRSGRIDFVRVPQLAATYPTQRRLSSALAGGEVPADFDSIAAGIQSRIAPLLRHQDIVIAHNAFTLHFNAALTVALSRLASAELRNRMIAWTHDIAAINPLYEVDLHAGYPWDLFRRPQPGVRYVAISRTRERELRELWRRAGVKQPPLPTIVPNGIDPALSLGLSLNIAKLAQQLCLYRRDSVLLLPVRITRRKNIEQAIEITAKLIASGQDAILLITGPTTGHHPARSRVYLSELRSLAQDLNCSDRVVFLVDLLGKIPARPRNCRALRPEFGLTSSQ